MCVSGCGEREEKRGWAGCVEGESDLCLGRERIIKGRIQRGRNIEKEEDGRRDLKLIERERGRMGGWDINGSGKKGKKEGGSEIEEERIDTTILIDCTPDRLMETQVSREYVKNFNGFFFVVQTN